MEAPDIMANEQSFFFRGGGVGFEPRILRDKKGMRDGRRKKKWPDFHGAESGRIRKRSYCNAIFHISRNFLV